MPQVFLHEGSTFLSPCYISKDVFTTSKGRKHPFHMVTLNPVSFIYDHHSQVEPGSHNQVQPYIIPSIYLCRVYAVRRFQIGVDRRNQLVSVLVNNL